MTALLLPIATRYLAGSILSLVLPLGILIVVTIWYVIAFRRGSDES